MFLLHLIAFFQICIIPGYLIMSFICRGGLKRELYLPVILGLSFLANYIIVSTLVILGSFNQITMLTLFIIECLLLLLVKKRILSKSKKLQVDQKEFFTNFTSYFTGPFSKTAIMTHVTAVLAILSIGFVLYHYFFEAVGSVFEAWDAVVSWNRWAGIISENIIPQDNGYYPLLIPANISMSYIITDSSLQFLPRIIIGFFFLSMIVTQVIIGFQKKHGGWFFSSVLMILVLRNLNWTDAYVDVPVAFFCWGAVLFILYAADSKNDREKYRLYLIGAIFVMAASVTKQGGLVLLVFYPIVVFIVSRKEKLFSGKKLIISILIYLSLMFIIVGSFYLHAQSLMNVGEAASNVDYLVNDIHAGRNYIERIVNGIYLVGRVFIATPLFFISCIFVFIAILKSTYRNIFLFLFLPSFILWLLFFSYDIRNASLSLVIFSMLTGFGLFETISICEKNGFLDNVVKLWRHWWIKIIVVFCIIAASLFIDARFRRPVWEQNHTEKVKTIGIGDLNSSIYSYVDSNEISGKIVTDYQYLKYLPELGHMYMLGFMNDHNTKELLMDPEVEYWLITPYYPNSQSRKILLDFAEQKIESGDFTEVFRYTDKAFKLFRFLKVK